MAKPDLKMEEAEMTAHRRRIDIDRRRGSHDDTPDDDTTGFIKGQRSAPVQESSSLMQGGFKTSVVSGVLSAAVFFLLWIAFQPKTHNVAIPPTQPNPSHDTAFIPTHIPSTETASTGATGIVTKPQISKTLFPPIARPASHVGSCWWKFDAYVPSEYETEWAEATTATDVNPCSRFKQEDADAWDSYWKLYHQPPLCTSRDSCPPIELANRSTPLGDKPPAPKIFSHFRYKKVCGDFDDGQSAIYWPAAPSGPETYEVVIEPLTGALRHPHYCFSQSSQNLFSKDYMFYSDPWLVQEVPASGRFLYFDAGASNWDSGSGGPSQSWIVPEFTNRWCIRNVGVWAWEAIVSNSDQIFGWLPPCLPPVYHWYNIKVSPEVNSSRNMWRHLETVARPEDFVVVKIDIDTPHVENPLIKELANTPHLHLLVDELFFEYHCNYNPICGPWGICGNTGAPSYKDALNLFSTIRRAGIRIHSWV